MRMPKCNSEHLVKFSKTRESARAVCKVCKSTVSYMCLYSKKSLELSVERLSSMKKYVFGLGSAQVLVTAVVVGLVSRFIAGQPSPAAIIIGDGLALSSTAVVLQDQVVRTQNLLVDMLLLGTTFSVLLSRYLCGLRNYVDLGCREDLAVVVLLILTPLISPNSSKGGGGG
ncbi:hypothetical protein CsSME_00012787 [Camellia sinensis var. sinensis]